MTITTISQALHRATQELEQKEIETPRLDAEVLLAYTLETNREQLYIRRHETLSRPHLERYQALIQRRANHEPMAYITSRKAFYGLDFYVDRRTFIPRPETELLVEKAVEVGKGLRSDDDRLKVVDVGTGCGAIAISLAVHLPQAQVYATDISSEILAVADINCRRHGVADRVTTLAGNLLEPLPEPVNLIVANLPYICCDELAELPRGIIDYEPLSALDGGEDGLDHIRTLLIQAPYHLKPGGAILLEIGAAQGRAVIDLARAQFPKATVEVNKDYSELDRLIEVRLPANEN